eukprot:3047212-Pleurochrysis_carterae.AAC.3
MSRPLLPFGLEQFGEIGAPPFSFLCTKHKCISWSSLTNSTIPGSHAQLLAITRSEADKARILRCNSRAVQTYQLCSFTYPCDILVSTGRRLATYCQPRKLWHGVDSPGFDSKGRSAI